MRRSKVYTLELMREHMQTSFCQFMKGIFQFRSASWKETGRFGASKGKWIVNADADAK